MNGNSPINTCTRRREWTAICSPRAYLDTKRDTYTRVHHIPTALQHMYRRHREYPAISSNQACLEYMKRTTIHTIACSKWTQSYNAYTRHKNNPWKNLSAALKDRQGDMAFSVMECIGLFCCGIGRENPPPIKSQSGTRPRHVKAWGSGCLVLFHRVLFLEIREVRTLLLKY